LAAIRLAAADPAARLLLRQCDASHSSRALAEDIMTFKRAMRDAGTFIGVMFAGTLAVAASAQTLPPDLIAKAKEFKQTDSKYAQALCEGSKSERADTTAARAKSQGELQKMIVDAAGTAPDVQKALDVATAAGDAADQVAANASSSDSDKTAAQSSFVKSKADLRDAVAREKARIEAQLGKDLGITLAARDECPDRPKAATQERNSKASSARREEDKPRQARRVSRQAPAGEAPAVSAPAASVGFGGGGLSIGIGR